MPLMPKQSEEPNVEKLVRGCEGVELKDGISTSKSSESDPKWKTSKKNIFHIENNEYQPTNTHHIKRTQSFNYNNCHQNIETQIF
jgi:hypothetical protein